MPTTRQLQRSGIACLLAISFELALAYPGQQSAHVMRNGAGAGQHAASAEANGLAGNLKEWLNLPPNALSQKLDEFRANPFHSWKDKQRAAYVLARTLQKSLGNTGSSGSGATSGKAGQNQGQDSSVALSPSGDTEAQARKIIALYEDAAKLDGMWMLAQKHITEIAQQCGLEPELRAHLQAISSKSNDAEIKAVAEYALAQSYFRTQDWDKAKAAFLKVQKISPTSNQGIGSNWYLALIDMQTPGLQSSDANSGLTTGAGTDAGDAAGDQPEAAISTASTALTTTAAAATTAAVTTAAVTTTAAAKAPTAMSKPLTANAVTYFRNYITACPDGRHSREIVDTLIAASDAANARTGGAVAPIPAADRSLFGQVYYFAGRWDLALRQWDLAGAKHLVERSICYFHTGKHKEAESTLLQAVRESNPSSHVSYVSAVELMANPLTKAQTCELWKKVLSAKPAKADTALWNIATRLPLEDAQSYFQRITTNYPTSEFAPESEWWQMWYQIKTHWRDKKLAPAVAIAHAGMKKYPSTKAAPKLAFWAGKMNELMHQIPAAQQDYQFAVKGSPSYYYGLRASTRLAALHGSADDRGWHTSPGRQLNVNWAWPDYSQFASGDTLKKTYGNTVAELLAMRQFDECVQELPANSDPQFKAAVCAAQENYYGAIRAASHDLNGPAGPSLNWQMAYPLEFGQYVAQGAQANNLDPLLIHALIREESRYNVAAISRSKAIGLTQLMPGTAYGVAKRLGVPLSGTADVFKPEINIKLGSNYLAYVLKRADGNALMAVASYNGGPGAVQAWLKTHAAAAYPDFDYFVENIMFRETRDYVRKVFGSYWNYERIYAEPPRQDR